MKNKTMLAFTLVLALMFESGAVFGNTDERAPEPEGNSTRDALLIYAAAGALTVAAVLGLSTMFKRAKLKQVLAKNKKLYENAVKQENSSLLFFASNKQEVRSLIKEGYYVDVTDDRGFTPLFSVQDPGAVRELLKNGADIHVRDYNGSTALFQAFNVGKAKELIEDGIDINARNDYGKNALSALHDVKRELLEEMMTDQNRSDFESVAAIHGQVAETIKYLTSRMHN